ncbi:DUF3152 domain-containing protein [Streptomyces sp. NPDC085937]|uniref:DUF3152 domain-containing protein n=1 Tax=Streptomyces sp. NPDC085937 TaxID=3365742 RepID=UPI0037D12F22
MGRHSRRGPAPKGDPANTTTAAATGRDARDGREARHDERDGVVPAQQQTRRAPSGAGQGHGSPYPGGPSATPAHGTPGTPGTPTYGHGHEAPGHGRPAPGVPRLPEGWQPDGTPARGVPRFGDGTPPQGVPRYADGTPAHGIPQVRGGHPEQQEPGGGWGDPHGRTATGAGHGTPAARQGVPLPRQRQAPADGPRQDYVEAFDDRNDDLFTPRRPAARTQADPYDAVTDWEGTPGTGVPSGRDTDTDDEDEAPTGVPAQTRGGRGRAFTGIAAAAVTTVLAVVVAGQVADDRDAPGVQQSSGEQARDVRDPASRGDARETPGAPPARPLTYEQQMNRKFPLAATRAGTGKFDAVEGIDKAPGKGRKITYRVDVERGLDLDGALFAEAVHRTLNDNRSWAHNGALTFERIHSGSPDFVITLAGPETTADWCAKSGLDTTEDNVSCDSAATERVMINAYRWAQGAETYGDKMYAYRQMLINHEIGHRLGHNHVTCDKDGDLAPVMQQQTKFLDHDGIRCRPNAWPYPKG